MQITINIFTAQGGVFPLIYETVSVGRMKLFWTVSSCSTVEKLIRCLKEEKGTNCKLLLTHSVTVLLDVQQRLRLQ